MTFANPEVLWLYLLLPIIVFFSITKSSQSSLHMSLTSDGNSFSNFYDRIGFHLPFIFRILCIALVIFALSRPQLGQSYTTSTNKGVDIIVAIDTSQSMSAVDLALDGKQVDRLTVVKDILKDFVAKRSSDRIGLLVFGAQAYTQCPLTTDHGAIVDLLQHIRIGMVGNSTAIGSAIAVAVKRLKDLKAKSRILVLMTDGQNTSGNISPKTALGLAKEFGIKIYTIGIGRNGEVPFVVDTPFGQRVINQQVIMDEDTLIQIAEQTGGEFFRAETTESLQRIYNHIDKLEKSKIEVKEYHTYKDVYEPFLWFAFLFFVLEVLLGNTLFFRIN